MIINWLNEFETLFVQVQLDTAESMSTVVELDRVKERMLVTERKLKQADNWCVLNDHIDTLFEEQVHVLWHLCAIFKLGDQMFI